MDKTSETPRTDALRTSDYILTRNDCLIGMDKYRDFARTLERELAAAHREREEARELLEQIGGGSFPNASTFAFNGDWQGFANALQVMARAFLAKHTQEVGP